MASVQEKKDQLNELIERTKELNEQLEKALDIVSNNPNIVDGIQVASELGRLDIVSLILGMFGLLIGVGAFFGFWMIKNAAINAAEDAAQRVINDKAASMFEVASITKGLDAQLSVTEVKAEAEEEILKTATKVGKD